MLISDANRPGFSSIPQEYSPAAPTRSSWGTLRPVLPELCPCAAGRAIRTPACVSWNTSARGSIWPNQRANSDSSRQVPRIPSHASLSRAWRFFPGSPDQANCVRHAEPEFGAHLHVFPIGFPRRGRPGSSRHGVRFRFGMRRQLRPGLSAASRCLEQIVLAVSGRNTFAATNVQERGDYPAVGNVAWQTPGRAAEDQLPRRGHEPIYLSHGAHRRR